MDKVILPALFIVISAGLFFSYIRPAYDALLAFQEQEERLDETIVRANNLQEKIDTLLLKYKSFSEEDLRKIDHILPSSVDVVRVIIQLDTLARASGVEIVNFDIPVVSQRPPATEGSVAWLDFTLVCRGDYARIKSMLQRIERSLTLMEVTGFSVNGGQISRSESGMAASTYELSILVPYLQM